MKANYTTKFSLIICLLILMTTHQVSAEVNKYTAKTPAFIENKGQLTDAAGKLVPGISHYIQLPGADIYLSPNKISYKLYRLSEIQAQSSSLPLGEGRGGASNPQPFQPVTNNIDLTLLEVEFIGANPFPEIINEKPSTDYINYYYAHCPNGIINVKSYEKVTLKNVWNNIDIVFYAPKQGAEVGLKYDFIIHPGGNPSDIKLKYSQNIASLTSIYADGQSEATPPPSGGAGGGLLIHTPLGDFNESIPRIYQLSESGQLDIVGAYQLTTEPVRAAASLPPSAREAGGGLLTFNIPSYNPTQTLIIDPFSTWATAYGGAGDDVINALSVDDANAIVVTGRTTSTSATFPTGATAGNSIFQANKAGVSDVIIAKFNENGVRLWSTYYGGTIPPPNTSSGANHEGRAVTTDNNNNVILGGYAGTMDFPVSASSPPNKGGASGDAFVMSFNQFGVRNWATFYGGIVTEFVDGIAANKNGNIGITGRTSSNQGFPLILANQSAFGGSIDAFAGMLDGLTGAVLWSTYLGGTGNDYGNGACFDTAGHLVISGETRSNGTFPQTLGTAYGGGFNDAFVASYQGETIGATVSGTKLWARFLGGSSDDLGNEIASDQSGNTYVTGYTRSTNFSAPLISPYQAVFGGDHDAFITSFNASGAIRWSTYYGGVGIEYGMAIAHRGASVLLTGVMNSSGFATLGAYQEPKSGGNDAYMVRFSDNGQIRHCMSYYGGAGNDMARGAAIDLKGNLLIAGEIGNSSTTFNTSGELDAYQQTWNGGTNDGFILKLCESCNAVSNLFISDKDGLALASKDSLCCADSLQLNVTFTRKFSSSQNDTTNPVKGIYSWSSIPAGFSSIQSQIWVKPTVTTSYIISAAYGSNLSGACESKDTITITVDPRKVLISNSTGIALTRKDTLCCADSLQLNVTFKPTISPASCSNTTNPVKGNYSWSSIPAGFSSTQSQIWVKPTVTTSYIISAAYGSNLSGVCESKDTITITVDPREAMISNSTGVALARKDSICKGNSLQLNVTFKPTLTPASCTNTTNPAIGNYSWTSLPAGFTSTNPQISVNPTFTTSYIISAAYGSSLSGGCQSTDTITVVVVAPIADAGPDVSISCNQTANLEATSSGGAGSPYTYQWTGGPATAAWNLRPVGKYYVTVTDRLGCTQIDSVEVKSAASTLAITALNASPSPICLGQTITLQEAVFGNIGTITYEWTGDATGNSGAGSHAITPITAGTKTFTLKVTDGNGCTATKSVDVTVNAIPDLNINKTNATCGANDGTATVTASGGSGTYTYLWDDPAVQTTAMANALAAGVYTVTVTDNTSNCIKTAIVTISNTGGPTAVNTTITNATCNNANGSFTITGVTGGAGGDTYDFNNTTVYTNTTNYTNLLPGTYPLSVKDASGCIFSTTVTIGQTGTVPVVTISGVNNICAGVSTTLTANGGTSWLWSPNGEVTQSITVNPSSTTTYSVTASNGACSATAVNVTVTVNANPIASISGITTICDGESTTLTGGGGPIDHWNTSATTTSITVNPSTTTTYTVFIRDANNCVDDVSQAVTVNPIPERPIATTPVIYCQNDIAVPLTATGTNLKWYNVSTGGTGSSTAPTPYTTTAGNTDYYVSQTVTNCESPRATITVTVNPTPAAPIITSPITYCQNDVAVPLSASGSNLKWYTASTGGTGSSTAPTPSTTTAVSTNYYVSQTVTNCESPRATITVTVNPTPIVTITGNSPICNGSSSTLTATGGISYSWNTTPVQTTASITVNPSTTTTYVVTVTDVNNCTAVASKEIEVNQNPVVIITGNGSICDGQFTTLTASGGLSYSWNTIPVQTTPSITVNPSSTTTYDVTATDVNNCTAIASQMVTVTSTPTKPSVTTPITYCQGATASPLTATGTALLWYASLTGGTGSSTAPTPITTSVGTTKYYVTQTVDGCESLREEVEVIVNVTPVLTFTLPIDSACEGTTVSFTVNSVPLSNTYTFTLNGNVIQTGTNSSVTIIGAPTGKNTLKVDAVLNNCPAIQVFTDFEVLPLPEDPAPTVNKSPLCEGEILQLFAQGTASTIFNWTGPNNRTFIGQNLVIPNVDPSYTGTYTVTPILTGCSGTTQSIDVLVNPLPQLAITANKAIACVDSPIVLTAAVTNGVLVNTWNWVASPSGTMTGANTQQLTAMPRTPTTYTLTAISNQLCSNSTTFDVITSPFPVTSAGNDTTVCINSFVLLHGTGGTPGIATYSWTPANLFTDPTKANQQLQITSVQPLELYLKITESGCFALDTINIKVDSCNENEGHAYIPNAFSPNGDGRNDGLTFTVVDMIEFNLSLFNRWGELIYTTNNPNVSWDGTYAGQPVEHGVYVYYIQGKGRNGKPVSTTGLVMLVR